MDHKVAIMQPYFLPYMGYWQLIHAVDEFVLYDNIQYTKKGWISRNRYWLNGRDEMFSLRLKSDSDFLDVRQRWLSPVFDRDKLVRQLREAYRKAPFFAESFPVIEDIILCKNQNLFEYIDYSVRAMCQYLGLSTRIVTSSDIPSRHAELKGEDKVLDICQALGASAYINPIGGVDLYHKDRFQAHGVSLSFLRARPLDYTCFGAACIPHMSILDVLMFAGRARSIDYLTWFDFE